jgi:hypothetical protein
MEDPARGEVLLDEVASVFKVNRSALAEGTLTRSRSSTPEPEAADSSGLGTAEERRMLRIAMGFPAARGVLAAGWSPDRFSTDELREVAGRLLALPMPGPVVDRVELLGAEGTELEPLVALLLADDDGGEVDEAEFDPAQELQAMIEAAERRQRKAQRERLKAERNDRYNYGEDWKSGFGGQSPGESTPIEPGSEQDR